ncbi:MAG: ATP-dependent sacrificial sulfur transferase LarE [Methanospirillum sp.]
MHDCKTTPDGNLPLEPKLVALKKEIERIGPLLVSYSGGVDSALLAVVARGVLGDRMTCAFLDSPLVPRAAVAEAREIAREHDLPLVVITHDPLEIPAFAANPSDRCYHCKKALAPFLKREATARGFPGIVDGVNCSDFGEHRPGLAASAEEGFEHPFVAAGITKPEIRAIARSLGLSFSEKPSAACLASRIPYGEPLTPALLMMVEEAEEELRGLGFSQGRVRVHGRLARIEVPAADLARGLEAAHCLVPALKAAGFAYVTLDLEGYRPGAMDEVLGDKPK